MYFVVVWIRLQIIFQIFWSYKGILLLFRIDLSSINGKEYIISKPIEVVP